MRRAFALLLVLALGCVPSAGLDDDERPAASSNTEVPPPTASFRDLNGVLWFYNTADGIRFEDITADLDDLHARGIRILGFYAPYDGDPEKWLGCDPLDFYRAPPQSGTEDDWRALVGAAHERGMRVVAYFVNIYVDRASELFVSAERQFAAGDRTSREVDAFTWTDDPAAPLPEPAAGPSAWQRSDVAGAWYWSLWGEAGLDHTRAGALDEIERFERFWLDTGLDGFMFDAAFVDPAFRRAMVELPTTHSASDKWLTFESTEAEHADAYDAFGLTSWFNLYDEDCENDYALVAFGDWTIEDLEQGLAHADHARQLGKLTHAWSIWQDGECPEYPDEERMRVQEAALLAGAGITYGAPHSEQYQAWAPTLRADWEQVLITVAANPALFPSASRARVPAGSDPQSYAMLRTASDGSQTALLVYNLQDVAAQLDVDLTATDVLAQQQPLDLYAGAASAAILDAHYLVELPPWGFQLLEVATE